MRVAVVEDDAQERAQLVEGLRRYERERNVRFSVAEFSDGEDLVTGYTAEYDLILMDIQMTFMDGMSAARRVRELDEDAVIVFITNAPQYAIEGYKVRAADYILKPLSWFSFRETLTRALRGLPKRTARYITIPVRDGRAKLNADGICYVEVQNHQLIYNTRDGKYVTKGSLADAEAQLDPRRFFRCNRCYLVNLQYVERYQGCDLRVNGDVIQISRRQRKPFLDALNEYLNGDGP